MTIPAEARPGKLPGLQSEYPLSEEQKTAFRRDGHILLRGVASSAEVTAYRQAITEAVKRLNTESRAIEERDTYGKAFLQIMNLWERDEAVRQFVLAPRFARIAAELMGVDGVRLYHDQALFKEPGGGPTPWHQDQHYWPLGTDDTITMWMPLVDISREMGPMTFASGSHRMGYLGDLPISDTSEAEFARLVGERGFDVVNMGAMGTGDATFHAGWTLHGAPGNATSRLREVMTVIYFADGTRALAPDNQNRDEDLKRWMPGVQPGEPAESPLNPLVYKK